jgi:hypothetical protein
MVLADVHKAITGPKFKHRTLQKQLYWKEGLAAEWTKLDNYANQNMCRPPSTAYIDTYKIFRVWMYSIKPNEKDHNKLRDFCVGSTRGGQTMVHGATNAPVPQQVDVCLRTAMSALICMNLWHADVTNVFADAECPDQIYDMCCDHVFRDWWADKHPDAPLPPDTVVPVLKNLQGHPGGPLLWEFRFHTVLVTLKFKNNTHAPCLYHSAFNDKFILYKWLTIFPFRADLKKLIPSYVTYWTKTGRFTCPNMA